MDASRLDTEELMQQMRTDPAVFESLGLAGDVTFHSRLSELMERRGYTATRLMERSGLSKSFLYQLLSGERLPGRDVVVRIALVLDLDLEETQRLLVVARKGSLYPKVRRDAAIICCILQGKGLFETDEFLEAAGEAPLL